MEYGSRRNRASGLAALRLAFRGGSPLNSDRPIGYSRTSIGLPLLFGANHRWRERCTWDQDGVDGLDGVFCLDEILTRP